MIDKISYLEPKSGNKPQNLVIFLHGFGSNKDDLISLSDFFAEDLPDTLFISPNAPKELDMMFNAYSWFSLDNIDFNKRIPEIPDSVKKEALESAKDINFLIDKMIKEYNIPEENVYIIGFSQGATMSILTASQRKTPVKAVLSYSGLLFDPIEWKSTPKRIGISHGKLDDVVPFSWHENNINILKTYCRDVKSFEVSSASHEITLSAIEFGKKILKESLK